MLNHVRNMCTEDNYCSGASMIGHELAQVESQALRLLYVIQKKCELA